MLFRSFVLQNANVININNIQSFFAPANGNFGMYFGSCNLTSQIVNNVLHQAVQNNFINSTISLQYNTPPAPPTGQGLIDKATLEANGCTVTTD